MGKKKVKKTSNLTKKALLIKQAMQLPTIEVGDTLYGGRFKNVKMEVTGFGKDKHNQPIVKTNKGKKNIFKFRLGKLIK